MPWGAATALGERGGNRRFPGGPVGPDRGCDAVVYQPSARGAGPESRRVHSRYERYLLDTATGSEVVICLDIEETNPSHVMPRTVAGSNPETLQVDSK
jgi:hypothetical protein